VSLLRVVEVPRRPVSLLEPIIGGPRHATVIAQKSLAEGFGLTVSEGMWKGRPVIGSAVGGIIDQIAEGTGILLPDPADMKAFGTRCASCLTTRPKRADGTGRTGPRPRVLPRRCAPDALRDAARHTTRRRLARY
jgi:glycosyltransferase involved in cell wall biosynthesis